MIVFIFVYFHPGSDRVDYRITIRRDRTFFSTWYFYEVAFFRIALYEARNVVVPEVNRFGFKSRPVCDIVFDIYNLLNKSENPHLVSSFIFLVVPVIPARPPRQASKQKARKPQDSELIAIIENIKKIMTNTIINTLVLR